MDFARLMAAFEELIKEEPLSFLVGSSFQLNVLFPNFKQYLKLENQSFSTDPETELNVSLKKDIYVYSINF